MSVAAPATPVNPKTPAMRATTRNVMTQRIMECLFWRTELTEQSAEMPTQLLLGKCHGSALRLIPLRAKSLKFMESSRAHYRLPEPMQFAPVSTLCVVRPASQCGNLLCKWRGDGRGERYRSRRDRAPVPCPQKFVIEQRTSRECGSSAGPEKLGNG